MTFRMSSLSVLIAGSLAATVNAQAFDVASVKRNLSGAPGAGGPTQTTAIRPGGAFVAVNTTLEWLIRSAYNTAETGQLREDQLVSGPGWIRTDRFDINAKAATESSRAVINLMVQVLLEDRFGLKVRKEQRERDVYVLKLARQDGRLGPDLYKASDDCRANRPKDPAGCSLRRPRPALGALSTIGHRSSARWRSSSDSSSNAARGR